MDKPVKVYVQQYKHKARVTMEVDLKSMKLHKGFYKAFQLYVYAWKELLDNNKLISKTTLQYNGKHLLQVEVVDIECCEEMINEFIKLGYCEIINVER